jgi:translation initiation factor 1
MRLFEGTAWDVPPRCERCQKLEAECDCPPPPKSYPAPGSQTVRVCLEKRAKGKMVTVVKGLSTDTADLTTLLTTLKTCCGAGGTVKDETLEIQGEHAARVSAKLTELGFRVKG